LITSLVPGPRCAADVPYRGGKAQYIPVSADSRALPDGEKPRCCGFADAVWQTHGAVMIAVAGFITPAISHAGTAQFYPAGRQRAGEGLAEAADNPHGSDRRCTVPFTFICAHPAAADGAGQAHRACL